MALSVLFFSAFLAATILPAQSELVLAALKQSGEYSVSLLVVVATVGNVLGSLVNWVLGFYLIQFKDRAWFPIKKPALDRASRFYEHYGLWTLLLAWVPIIGDPLTLVAGMFRTNLWLFLLLVTIGKTSRYIAIIWIL